MLQCEYYHPARGGMEKVGRDAVPGLLGRSDGVLWIEIIAPTDDELEWLAATFSFHALAMEDVRNQRQRPKLDEYPGYRFFVLRSLEYHPHSHVMASHQLDAFIGHNYLVTVHRGSVAALTSVRERLARVPIPDLSPAFLFYLVSDAVVDGYFPIIDEIGERIDAIDIEVTKSADQRSLQEIFQLRRALLTARKMLGPLRDAFNELLRIVEEERSFGGESARAYFTDVHDHILRVTDFIDTYRDMLSASMEAYQSSLANKLNHNMQRLTVAATVLATGTVITGFFGMNLQGAFINSDWPYAGQVVLTVLVVVTLVEVWLFRRAKWL